MVSTQKIRSGTPLDLGSVYEPPPVFLCAFPDTAYALVQISVVARYFS